MQIEFGFLTNNTVDRRTQLLLDTHKMFRSLADDDRFLGIAFHINRHNHVRFAIVSFATIVVFRLFDGIHDYGQ